jgi:hypothetical protein
MRGDMKNEACTRNELDALPAVRGLNRQDTTAFPSKVVLPLLEGNRTDNDVYGRSLAVLEVKRLSISPIGATTQ